MSEAERLELLGAELEWVPYIGNDKHYYVCNIGKRYRYLKIPPGGFIHKHTDKAGWRRFYVLQTNPESIFYLEGEPHHLELGHIYDMDGRLEHWAENNGDSDRIHFIDMQIM